MKRIYVAGAYSADNVLDVLKNIGRGEYWSAQLFTMGFAPFCPWHDKDFVIKNFDHIFTVQMFYDYSMAWLDVSHAIYLVEGWENSKGTKAEIKRAKELGIPIFEDVDKLVRYFKENE